jgi:hypothetical protein
MTQKTLLDLQDAAPVATDPAPGELVCTNCGAIWPGSFGPFWIPRDGRWYHWCHGGKPGLWYVAKPTNRGQP